MKFDDVWAAMQQKNPKLLIGDAKVTITASQFRLALQQAFHLGYSHRTEQTGKREPTKQQPVSSSMEDLFSGMFGK